MAKLACLYARASTDDQVGSIPAQEAQIEAFAKKQHYRIVERFHDDGVTGTTLNRPGLNRLIQKAGYGAQWKYVLVWDRSRLGRPEDPREAIATTFHIEKHDKKIVALQGAQQTDNPILDTVLEALEFGQAGEESLRKSRDVLRGQHQSAIRGSLPNGKTPFGYDAIYRRDNTFVRRVRYLEDGTKQLLTEDGTHVLESLSKNQRWGKGQDETIHLTPGHPAKINIVQRIYREFIAGRSCRSIAHDLNKEGVSSPRGTTWGKTSIKRAIANPAYMGQLSWNRHSLAKFHRVTPDGIQRIKNPDKKMMLNKQEEWITTPNLWPGLVAVDEWEKANHRLNQPQNNPQGNRPRSPFLCSGLLICTCGSHYAGSSFQDKRNPNKRYEYYRCQGRLEKGTCTAQRIPKKVIDTYIEQKIQELYLEPQAQTQLLDEITRQLDDALLQLQKDNNTQERHRELETVDEQIQRIVKAIGEGTLTSEESKSQLQSLRQQKKTLEEEFSTTSQAAIDIDAIHRDVLDQCRKQLQHESELWPNGSNEEKKTIVRAHVVELIADPTTKTLHVTFTHPMPGFPDTMLGCCVRPPRQRSAPV